jgi:hypothetical protein
MTSVSASEQSNQRDPPYVYDRVKVDKIGIDYPHASFESYQSRHGENIIKNKDQQKSLPTAQTTEEVER